MARFGNDRVDGLQTNKFATRERRLYRDRKARGECPSCGKRPPEEGWAQCNPCRMRKNAASNRRNKRMYKLMTALKVCCVCKQREAMTNRKWCGVCAEMHTEMSLSLRERRRKEGKCTRCGGDKPCEKCLAKGRQKAAQYKRRKRERLAQGNARETRRTRKAA